MTRSATSPTTLLLLALLAAAPVSAQRPARSIVIVTGGEPSMPIPTLMEGRAEPGGQLRGGRPPLSPAGQSRPRPHHRGRSRLRARAGAELEPARLADPGVRARSPRPLARRHAGDRARRRVRLRAGARPGHRAQARDPDSSTSRRSRPTATSGDLPLYPSVRRAALRRHLARAPLPAHLLASCRPTGWRARPFVERPVGNGPYRWVRRVARRSSSSSRPTPRSSWAGRGSTG